MMGNCSTNDRHYNHHHHHHHQHRIHGELQLANVSHIDSTEGGCEMFHLIVNSYLMSILCIMGIIGNTISMIILRIDRQNRIASLILQTLACVDNLLLGLSFITLTVVSKTRLSDSKVAIINSFGYVAQASSIWVTVLLGINRYYAVCKPLKSLLVTLRSVKIQIAVVLVSCVLFNFPRFFPMTTGIKKQATIETFDSNKNDSSSTTSLLANISDQRSRKEIVNSNKMIYESLYTILVLILPLVLLICINFRLARSLGKLKRRLRSFRKDYKGSNEANITVVMVVIVIVMVVCHTPDRVLEILKLLRFYRDSALSVSNGVSRFPCCPNAFSTTQYLTNLFIVFSSSVNFLIYFVLRKRFRRILKYKLLRLCFKSERADRSMNNTATMRHSTGYVQHRSVAL